MSLYNYILCIPLYLLLWACNESSTVDNPVSSESNSMVNLMDLEINNVDDMNTNEADAFMEESCDSNIYPLIMVHGFLAAGDTWAKHVRRFIIAGHCASHLIVFDWNTLDQNLDHAASLNQVIDRVRTQLDVDQVDLMGHSAGGGLGYEYLSNPDYASKVRRYVHVGSFVEEGPAGSPNEAIPTLNLWSPGDKAVEGADIPGAMNVTLMNHDHYTVATSPQSFEAIYAFLYDRVPQDEAIYLESMTHSKPSVQITGKALTLGENLPEANTRIDLWSLDEENGQRVDLTHELTLNETGAFGPLSLNVGQSYEISTRPDLSEAALAGEATPPAVRYFRPALRYDDSLVYLRTFPSPGTLTSLILNPIPLVETQSVLVIFNSSQTFLEGRDELTLNGDSILTPDNASAENTTIALFVFDINQDGQTGGTLPLFENFPFLAAIDYPLTPDPEGYFHIIYEGQEIKVPAIPSSDGVLIAVFP
jgi:pimeloyl-ACP methyl ester carboxylesterase